MSTTAKTTLKRYDPSYNAGGWVDMEEHERGEWVRFSEVAAHDDLVAACEAAIRYDESICGRAAKGEVDMLANGAGVATGDDLDDLYFDWMDKARAALAKART